MQRRQVLTLVGVAIGVSAQDPEYYANIDFTLQNAELKQQLHDLISPHTVVSYDDAWAAFSEIDKNLPTYPCDNDPSHIPDVYSNYCWTTDKTSPGGQCGNYKGEGDCYNREHSWPKSWFGGFDAGHGAESDLFELYPTDGYVNGLRGNYPLGYVDVSQPITYTSSNGALLGRCLSDSTDGKSTRETGGTAVDRSHLMVSKSKRDKRMQKRDKKVANKYGSGSDQPTSSRFPAMLEKLRSWFSSHYEDTGSSSSQSLQGSSEKRAKKEKKEDEDESADDNAPEIDDDFWKQDDDYSFSGQCFEIADMYKGDFARSYFYLSTAYMDIWTCCNDVGVNSWEMKPWMENEMREWHKMDPVDSYEIARNNLIYSDYQHNRNPFIDYPELVDQINDF